MLTVVNPNQESFTSQDKLKPLGKYTPEKATPAGQPATESISKNGAKSKEMANMSDKTAGKPVPAITVCQDVRLVIVKKESTDGEENC